MHVRRYQQNRLRLRYLRLPTGLSPRTARSRVLTGEDTSPRIAITAAPLTHMEVLSRTRRRETGVDEAQASPAQTVWWINPWQLFLLFIIPVYTLVFLTPALFGEQAVVLRSRIFFTGEYYLLGLGFLLLFAIWAGLIAKLDVGYPRSGPSTFHVKRVYLDILAILTLTAYCIMLYPSP